MRRTWLVARREYLENVKTKAFVIGVLLMPVLWVALLGITKVIEKRSGPDEVAIAVIDDAGGIFPGLAARASAHDVGSDVRPRFRLEEVSLEERTVDEARADLARRARADEIHGYLVVEKGVVEGTGGASYGTRMAALREIPRQLERWLNDEVALLRMRSRGLDPSVVAEVSKTVPLERVVLGKEAGDEDVTEGATTARFLVPVALVFLLFIGIFTVAQACLTSLVEEKSNRIVEVVLASMSAREFMIGKILGTGLMGLTLLSVWGGGAYAAVSAKGLGHLVPLDNLVYLLVYFVLGFFLYAALFSAIGSACNTLKEAQNLIGPLTLVLVVPMVLLEAILRDPGSAVAVAFSFVPPFTPFVMMSRLAATPAPGLAETLLSIAVLAAAVVFVLWASGKVFRVGVLMYGKPPRPGELLRWIRQG